MDKKTYRLPLQFFAEDVDFGAVFGVEEELKSKEENTEPETDTQTENGAESDTQEHSNEEKGEISEPAIQTPLEEIPNEVWKKARQKAEYEAQQKIQKAQEEFYNNLADEEYLGNKNPYNDKLIRTKQDQQEYLESYSKETLKSNGLDENIIQKMIDNNPIMQEAKRVTELANKERGETQLRESLKQISELNSDIKSFEDLAKLPNRSEIDDLVINKGYTLVDAYKLVNFDELLGKKTAVAKQQAINAVKGKAHLVSTDGTGSDDVVVPSDVMEQYKLFLPNATLSEIKKHYAKTHK